jgi:hypothetical protein
VDFLIGRAGKVPQCDVNFCDLRLQAIALLDQLCVYTLRATSQREELYKNFIEEASRLYADALVNDKSEVSKLVDLYALIARMKILSSDAVIEAAEKAGRLILDTYLSPNRTFVDLPDLINEMDPLRDFSEACRRELQSADRR